MEDIKEVAQDLFDAASGDLEENAANLKATLCDAAGKLADKVGQAKQYVQVTKPSDMFNDLQEVVKRYPTQSLVIATCFGFLLAYTTRRDD